MTGGIKSSTLGPAASLSSSHLLSTNMTVATSASDEQEIEIQICEDDEDEIINLDVRGRA